MCITRATEGTINSGIRNIPMHTQSAIIITRWPLNALGTDRETFKYLNLTVTLIIGADRNRVYDLHDDVLRRTRFWHKLWK